MKVKIEIHSCLTAWEIFDHYESHKEYFSKPENSQGIYFHKYKDSGLPFYIGISDNMLERNYDHLKLYKKDYRLPGAKYWLPKDPDKLIDLGCFKTDGYDTNNFYSPNRPDDVEGRELAIKKLFDNMSVLFSRVIPENPDLYPIRQVVEQVERQLQDNLVSKALVQPDWIGRTGSNKGGGLDNVAHDLTITYAPLLDANFLT